MEIRTYNVYKFRELSDEAKQEAIEKYRYINTEFDWLDCEIEDAIQCGLAIEFDVYRRTIDGKFISSAIECCKSIISEHGKNTKTYKIASEHLQSLAIVDGLTDDESKEQAETDFLTDILQYYLKNITEQMEYLGSDKAIIETLEANGYDFTESGKID